VQDQVFLTHIDHSFQCCQTLTLSNVIVKGADMNR
jgi:hypothetical protein